MTKKATKSDLQLISPGHSMCAGCGVAIAVNLISRSCPQNLVVSMATSCLEVTTTMYPRTAFNTPVIHCAFETASSVASGMEAAIKHLGKDWKVMAIAGDGGTFDIGIQSLSGMMERGHKVTQVCVDNECYANCLSLSTTVMTKDGLKRITDIKKGDEVYAFDMKNHEPIIKKCTGVFDNGVKDVYDLGTLHHMIRATKNHPFLTIKENGRGKGSKLVWKTLSELRIGDLVFVLEGQHFEMEKINYKKHIGKEPTLDLRVEGEHNFIADGIVVHNTGVQRSGATPYGAWTTTSPPGKKSIGKHQFKKPIAEIIAAHKIPYVASASIAYPTDLITKAKKAFDNQPSFLHIHSPCPTGWKFGTADTVKISRLAVETGMWVLYEIENGQLRITHRVPKKKPVEDYLKLQGRFKHLQPDDVNVIQKHVESENERLEKIEKSGIRY